MNQSNNVTVPTEEIQLVGPLSSKIDSHSKRNHPTIKNYLDGPTLIQRSDAQEVEVFDADRVQSTHKSAMQGVLLGVLCPTLQNIFGIILFIRFPSLTGELGLGMMLVCVFLSIGNTFFTALCVSAIVTNGRVKNGGNYYMISRTLGPAFGGSVAILEFLANSFGTAFYFLGASETLITWSKLDWTGDELWDMRFLSLMFLVFSYILNIFGLKYVARTDFLNLMIVIVGILMMFIGCLVAGERELDDSRITGLNSENFSENWYGIDSMSFSTAIGICYPAVTGIMAGVNRSGDLKNPAKDVPRGTIGAHLFTSFFYVIFPILYAGVAQRASLLDENQIFNAIVCWPHPVFVSLAIIIASAGAGLQTTVNAPRIFMALCEDKLLPLTFFGKHLYRSMMVTATISFCVIMIGKLDEVAPYLTMFFLMAYFWICVSCLMLDLLDSANWRPTWKYYNKLTSIIGLLSCLVIMFIISWWISLIAIAIQMFLFVYILRTASKNWGDSIEYFKVSMVINSLYKIDKLKFHVKNWRPNILVLPPKSDENLFGSPGILNFLKYIKNDVGIAVYGNCIEGDLLNLDIIEKGEKIEKTMINEIKKRKLRMVVKNEINTTYEKALLHLIYSSGLGPLNPNTVLFSWPNNWREDPSIVKAFLKAIELADYLHLHIIILKPDMIETYNKNIDIWSFSYEKGLKEMFVHILQKSKHWKNCTVRLFIATSLRNTNHNEEDKDIISNKIISFFKRYRLLNNIEINIVDISEEESDWFPVPIEEKMEAKQKLLLTPNLFPEQQSKLTKQIDMLKQLSERVKNNQGFRSIRSEAIYEAHDMIDIQSHELNKKITEKSQNSDLVIVNLPNHYEDITDNEYLEFCEKLTKSLNRVIFIKNSGAEVITELV